MKFFKRLIGVPVTEVRRQAEKPQSRFTYTDGPMYFLGQQIVKGMQQAGYPAKIHCCYRTPEEQQRALDRGASNARPFRSPHQFYEAVDIIHESFAWFHPDLRPPSTPKEVWEKQAADFWETLAAVSRTVADRYGVRLELGHDWGWDSAHIELRDWRDFRRAIGMSVPTRVQLAARFSEVLPHQWKQFQKSKSFTDFASKLNSDSE